MATEAINFTQECIERLPIPPHGWVYYADSKTPGLRIGVGASGSRTFYLCKKIQGRAERIRIGPYPDLSVSVARTKAWQLKGAIGSGANPAEVRRALVGMPTLANLLELYIEKHAKPKGRKSWPEMEAQFHRYLSAIGKKKVSQISKEDIERLVTKLALTSGKTTANRVIELVRAIFNWARRKGVIDLANPAIGVDRYPTTPRDRYLHRSEMPSFLEAVEKEDQVNRDFFLLLLLTGVRRGNLMSARWADLNLDDGLWRISAEQSKNGRAQYVRLPPPAVEILRSRKSAGNEQDVFVFLEFPRFSGHYARPA